MGRICLVSYNNIYVLPYARLYIEEIIKSGNTCNLLYWDRDVNEKKDELLSKCKTFTYKKYVSGIEGKNKIKKLSGYFNATRYFKKVIKNEKFDKLIFLETHGAILCSDILLKDYRNRYIVDVRDYSVEGIYILYKREKLVIENAYATVISSPAYKKFLPVGKYVISHNYVPFSEDEIERVKNANHFNRDNIRISFIGTVRFLEMDKKILNTFKNDKRFIINYFGRGSENLIAYCKENGISNISFEGGFKSSETSSFYERTDIVNNLYGNNIPSLDYALSNKLYHSAQFELPILVCKNTFMEEISIKYNLGFVFDFEDPDIKDKLYDWYFSMNKEKLRNGASLLIREVEAENAQFYKKINDFLEV